MVIFISTILFDAYVIRLRFLSMSKTSNFEGERFDIYNKSRSGNYQTLIAIYTVSPYRLSLLLDPKTSPITRP